MSRTDSVQADFSAQFAQLPARLNLVLNRISTACRDAGREPQDVHLLAVSKTCPAEAVRAAQAAGQNAFGENYVQEGVDKIAALRSIQPGTHPGSHPDTHPGAPLEWHYIGPLQTNKTRQVAENFAWVHAIDRLKIAERLSAQRPAGLPPLNLCIQINLDGAANKSGIAPDAAAALARAITTLPNLKLRGLMSIPEPAAELEAQRLPHRALKQLLDQLNLDGLRLDTLSMGMSADLEAAILEGATMVRVGTAIFGERTSQ